MGWVLRLVESGADGSSDSIDVLEIERPGDLGDLADLGLTHAEGKQLLTRVQQAVVAAQSRDHAARRPACRTCGAACQLKDYRPHQIATVFGPVTVRLPRFRCAGCDRAQAGIGWPAHGRSTPELDQLRAQYAAFLPYRVAAGVLEHLLPVAAGITHGSMSKRGSWSSRSGGKRNFVVIGGHGRIPSGEQAAQRAVEGP